MANTYTQIYLHAVFSVSGRVCVISSDRREELQKYITGIVTRHGQKLIAIFCMPDHTHLLLGLKPNIAPSDLIGDIKTGSTNHINEQKWIGCRFSWQEGFGAFSFRIRMWDALPITSTISRCITVENHSKKNTSNSSSGITSHSMSDTFSNRWNNLPIEHAAPMELTRIVFDTL